jgi:hypothetical protein
MTDECMLANSVADRAQELIDTLQSQLEYPNRRSTDGVTFSLEVNHTIKCALKDIRALIGDSGLDGRFKKGRRRNRVVS